MRQHCKAQDKYFVGRNTGRNGVISNNNHLSCLMYVAQKSTSFTFRLAEILRMSKIPKTCEYSILQAGMLSAVPTEKYKKRHRIAATVKDLESTITMPFSKLQPASK